MQRIQTLSTGGNTEITIDLHAVIAIAPRSEDRSLSEILLTNGKPFVVQAGYDGLLNAWRGALNAK